MPLANKKVLDLMKNENNGAIMTEFVGLRAKYIRSIQVENLRPLELKKCAFLD